MLSILLLLIPDGEIPEVKKEKDDPEDNKVMEGSEYGKEKDYTEDDKALEGPEDEKKEEETQKAPVFILKTVNGKATLMELK